jgi:hypothetical protein
VFAANSVSVRSEKDINLRADRDLNIEAGRNINLKAAKDYVDDRDLFLSGYADSEGNSILNSEVFNNAEKLSIIKDDKEVYDDYLKNKNITSSFRQALENKGITSIPGNTSNQTTSYTAYGHLSAVELIQIIRGSHLVGEGLGEGGHIHIQAKGDMNMNAAYNSHWSAESGNIDIFAGLDMKTTVGTEWHNLVGTKAYFTAGTTMDFTTGDTLTQTVGGEYNFTVLKDSSQVYRGDTTILFEGYNLNIEAQPVKYSDTGREIDHDTAHQTTINLENFDLSAEKIYLTSKFRLSPSSEPGEIHIKSNGDMFIDSMLTMNLKASTAMLSKRE